MPWAVGFPKQSKWLICSPHTLIFLSYGGIPSPRSFAVFLKHAPLAVWFFNVFPFAHFILQVLPLKVSQTKFSKSARKLKSMQSAQISRWTWAPLGNSSLTWRTNLNHLQVNDSSSSWNVSFQVELAWTCREQAGTSGASERQTWQFWPLLLISWAIQARTLLLVTLAFLFFFFFGLHLALCRYFNYTVVSVLQKVVLQ